MNHLGKYIQNKLSEQGISEREMAKKCNISHSYLNQLIRGANPSTNKPISPTLGTLTKLSKGFEVSVENLQKIAYGIPEEQIIKNTDEKKQAFMSSIEQKATEKGIPVGSNSDRLISWEIWNEIKKAHTLMDSMGIDPSEHSKEDWQDLLRDISLVIKLHNQKDK